MTFLMIATESKDGDICFRVGTGIYCSLSHSTSWQKRTGLRMQRVHQVRVEPEPRYLFGVALLDRVSA